MWRCFHAEFTGTLSSGLGEIRSALPGELFSDFCFHLFWFFSFFLQLSFSFCFRLIDEEICWNTRGVFVFLLFFFYSVMMLEPYSKHIDPLRSHLSLSEARLWKHANRLLPNCFWFTFSVSVDSSGGADNVLWGELCESSFQHHEKLPVHGCQPAALQTGTNSCLGVCVCVWGCVHERENFLLGFWVYCCWGGSDLKNLCQLELLHH